MYKQYKEIIINFIKSNSGIKFLYAKLTSPLFLTSTFFLILFTLFTPIYEESDDVTMTLITNGLYTGEPSPYLVYINIIPGKFLALLYRAYPNWNWYSAFLYGVAFISLLSLLSVVVNKIKSKLLLAISVLFVFIFYLRFLLFFQYTTIAALAATSGLFLFLFLVNNNKGNARFAYTIAYSLLFISSLIRDQAFYLITILAIPVIIITYKKHLSKRKVMIIFLLMVMLGVGTAKYIHYISYNKNSVWNKFMLLENPRGQLSGYGLYNYDQNKQVYNKTGWSKNDYLMFNTWFYYDEDTFSTKKLQFILSSIKYKNFNSIILNNTLSRFSSNTLSVLPFILLNVLISIATWPSIKNKTYFLTTCSIGLFIFIYFSYLGGLPQRVSLPILFFVGFSSLYFTSNHNSKLNKLNISKTLPPFLFYTLLYILLTTILLFIAYYWLVNNENKKKIASFQTNYEQLPNKDTLVVVWRPVTLHYSWLHPFDDYSKFRNHTILLGNWMIRTPHNTLLSKKFNINNIYIALYKHDNIYLVMLPSHTKLLQVFMKERYNKDVYFESIHRFKFSIEPYKSNDAQLFKVKLRD